MTHAPSQRTSTGQTREQLRPRILDSRMVVAEPRRLRVEIFLMKRGTSICVGQATVQGASKQKRQRIASTVAACGSNGGWISAKAVANFSGDGGETASRMAKPSPGRHRHRGGDRGKTARSDEPL